MYIQQPLEVKTELDAHSATEINAGSDVDVMPGWMCMAIGVGFIALIVIGIVGARSLAN